MPDSPNPPPPASARQAESGAPSPESRASSPEPGAPLIHLRDVIKDYRGLRPLRIRELALGAGESVALLGLDEAMAGVLVDLLTAGSLPDTGEVIVFGESTGAVTTRERWLAVLDRFGLVSERGVLLEQLTAEQNLAIPLSLEVETMTGDLRAAVRRLADEVGIAAAHLSMTFGQLPPPLRLRVRLGRALALDPMVLLAEHPNARLSPRESEILAADVARITGQRGIAALVCTADQEFAHGVATHVLELQPATGALKSARLWPWKRKYRA